MNMGTDYARAKQWTQANADRDQAAWQVFVYHGTCWGDRVPSDGAIVPGAEVLTPRKPTDADSTEVQS